LKKSKKNSPRKNNETATKKIRDAIYAQKILMHVALIIILGILIYSNTFNAPFILDDENSIVQNIGIKDFRFYTDNSISKIIYSSRLVGHLSFALNYGMHGLNVTGYHIVNLLIHLSCALLVYWFIVLIFRTPYFSEFFHDYVDQIFNIKGFVALFTALLFVSHPVQTQAVTYIVQRYASLATLFYLLSLVMYVKFRLSETPKIRYVFYAISVVSAILAMKTKEIAFTLPVIIVMYEFLFLRGEMWKRLLYLIPVLLTMAIIPLSLMIMQGYSSDQAVGINDLTKIAGSSDIPRWDYLNTQFRVIVTYLRLLFLPINQNLDYDYPIYRTFFTPQVYISFLLFLSILGGAVYLLYKSLRYDKNENNIGYRLIAFGIFWFFVTLSVESSFIPIADVIFEHRLYLPSVGFFIVITSVVLWIRGRLGVRLWVTRAVLVVMALVVVCLSVTAHKRNRVWQDEVRLWEDVVKKSPDKQRAIYNLGEAYSKKDSLSESMREYQQFSNHKDKGAEAYNSLGNVYLKQLRLDEAVGAFRTALQINPNYADAHNSLGMVYFNQGRVEESIREFQRAIDLQPKHAAAQNNLGSVYAHQGHYNEAIKKFKIVLQINPDYVEVHNNLGVAYYNQGQFEDALREYNNALKINPDYGEALRNIGNLYRAQGRYTDARREYEKILKLKSNFTDARANLNNVNAKKGSE